MGATKCPRHGTQIASVFCEHASDSVDARTSTTLYLQKNKWGWFTLCSACIRRRDDPDVQNDLVLVCGKCIVDWAEATGSDYVQRCQNPVPESPPCG
jgi:hypothetical protein